MSLTKDFIMNLSALPEYRQGWGAYESGKGRTDHPPLKGDAGLAWLLGWDQAKVENQPEPDDEFPTHPFVEGNDN